jgi:hypothetical protein
MLQSSVQIGQVQGLIGNSIAVCGLCSRMMNFCGSCLTLVKNQLVR